jgi:hypothetical protein
MVVFLAGFAHGGGIHERHVGCRVRHHHGVEERLVAGLQVGEEEVLLQVVVERFHLRVHARDLQVERVDGRRQQTLDAQGLAVGSGKGGAAVLVRLVQQGVAGQARCGRIGHG